MGEILALRAGWAARALALAGFAWLAACTNDPEGNQSLGMTRTLFEELRGRLAKGGAAGKAATPDPEALAASAMRSFKGPIVLAQIVNTGGLFALGEYGRNGDVQTFSTPTEETLVLRRGILIASRGLGDDLMSSETSTVAALVLSRGEGSARHVYRFLDGEGIERPLPMDCDIRRQGDTALRFAGTDYRTTEMVESCRHNGTEITNRYWVTSGGLIALSQQWISPRMGYVTIQRVRG